MALFEAWFSMRTPISSSSSPPSDKYYKWLKKHNSNPPREVPYVIPEVDCVIHNFLDGTTNNCVNCNLARFKK